MVFTSFVSMTSQDAHMKTLDEVKDQIEPMLKQQKAQQIAQKQAETCCSRLKQRDWTRRRPRKACRS